METALLVGLIAATVTVAGWLVTHWLQFYRENYRRRMEGRLGYLERQIEELYGPLFNLVIQIILTNHVRHGFWAQADDELRKKQYQIDELFYSEHFQLLHEEIRNLLKTRLHLVQGRRLPESFYRYLRHSIQERIQWDLSRHHKLDTSSVERISFPNEFTAEVQDTLKELLEEYNAIMEGLHKTTTANEKPSRTSEGVSHSDGASRAT